MRIYILEHEPESPPGLLADWARDRGHSLEVLAVPALSRWPSPAAHDLVVSLGSDRSVHASQEEWIEKELDYVRAVHNEGVPVLGICFGGQLLAAALGGSVRRARKAQAGWRDLPTLDPDLIAPGPWFRWHEDAFELPPGARLLAGSPTDPLAFVSGSSVGLQFHPEVAQDMAQAWMEGGRHQMLAQGIDERALVDDISRAAAGARERAFGLFDRFERFWQQDRDRQTPQPRAAANVTSRCRRSS